MSNKESIVEDTARAWFGELGYAVGHGAHLAPGEPAGERDSFGEMVLVGRLHNAIQRLIPVIPEQALVTILQFRSTHISTERATNPRATNLCRNPKSSFARRRMAGRACSAALRTRRSG